MNPFKSKVKCRLCGYNYRRKTEKGTVKLICGGYSKGIGCKERVVIFESYLRELINNRYNRELSDEEIVNVLDYIEFENERILDIYFKDGSDPILLRDTFLQF
jgi:hypothetical protein